MRTGPQLPCRPSASRVEFAHQDQVLSRRRSDLTCQSADFGLDLFDLGRPCLNHVAHERPHSSNACSTKVRRGTDKNFRQTALASPRGRYCACFLAGGPDTDTRCWFRPKGGAVVGTTDTWGIASADFLRWYLLAAFLAVALVLLSNWLASHRSVPASPTGRVLTPPEVGALTNDTQAVMASLAILRGADVIDSRGRVRRALTATERTHLDWFTRTVLERLGSGKAPLVRSRLVTNMSVACAQLRSQLIDEGLLHGRSERGASTVRVFPILFVAAVGFVRVISGIANGKPVLFLVGIIVLLLLTLPFVRRRRRRTAQGDAELRRLRVENDYLSPRSRPSFTAYGPSRAGMSAALFGAGALLMLDPAMAGALSYGSAQAGGAASFGFGGDSGGGSSGDGGGSSCGGGGGCGGGGRAIT
ncbi:hypothetical protein CH294_08750, partial [Rhodococcus sp. 14-2483-1-1]